MISDECAVSRCQDGQMHFFRICDDGGPTKFPACGAQVESVDRGNDETDVCEGCVGEMARFLAPDDPEAFLRELENVRPR